MTNAQRDAMQVAKGAVLFAAYAFRDAHIYGNQNLKIDAHTALDAAIDAALREATAEPVVEPAPVGEVVAYKDSSHQWKRIRGYERAIAELPVGAKVYASPPPQAEAPLLTRDEIWGIWNMGMGVDEMDQHEAFKFARAIEQAIKAKAGRRNQTENTHG